jgi:uncharacterized protein
LRILASADIHGVMSVYEWLAESVETHDAEILVLAGDLLLGGWEEEQNEQAQRTVLPLLKMVPVPVLYVMGNDDCVSLDYEDEQVKPLHGRGLSFGRYSFVGYQYSPPFVGGIHEKPEEEIETDLRQLEPLLDERTVFVTHSPAYGFADRIYAGEHVGSHSLAKLLESKQVLCHIHGHIHHSFGQEGNHFNVAASGRRRAMVIDLPSLAHKVIEGE